eukprot:5352016-Alexandrium_andersonii.AAC.1
MCIRDRPYPVLHPAREAQPYGPFRPLQPADAPLAPAATASETGGAMQLLAPGSAVARETEEIALRARRQPPDD